MDDPSLNGRQRIELGLRLLAFSLGSGELGTFERAGARIERAVEAMPAAPRIGRFGERLAVYTIVPKVARVTVALIRGEFARAEVLMIATGELGERIGTLRARDGDENEFLMWLQLRGYQGRASELEPLLEARLEKFPDDHWEAAVAKAQFALERGELERAKQQYRLLSVTRFQVPREGRLLPAKLATRVRMADLCAAIGSSKDALALYEGLLPDAGSCVSHGALISFGSIARPLGELAHKLGNYERAASHFERALETNLRFGHRPEVVRTRLGLARTLCALGRFDEAELESAAAYADAESMGMAPCSELARELSPLRSSR
jgi:tetratricopeptide (TPR) repeat protein